MELQGQSHKVKGMAEACFSEQCERRRSGRQAVTCGKLEQSVLPDASLTLNPKSNGRVSYSFMRLLSSSVTRTVKSFVDEGRDEAGSILAPGEEER